MIFLRKHLQKRTVCGSTEVDGRLLFLRKKRLKHRLQIRRFPIAGYHKNVFGTLVRFHCLFLFFRRIRKKASLHFIPKLPPLFHFPLFPQLFFHCSLLSDLRLRIFLLTAFCYFKRTSPYFLVLLFFLFLFFVPYSKLRIPLFTASS